jgi:hypothetical protein
MRAKPHNKEVKVLHRMLLAIFLKNISCIGADFHCSCKHICCTGQLPERAYRLYFWIKLIYRIRDAYHIHVGGKNMAEMRNFALRDAQGNEIGVFTGKSPRQAALKAANRGYTDIKLRERGTKKVHVFVGERVQVDKPKGAPAWMPDKIWKPKVKKVDIDKLDEV